MLCAVPAVCVPAPVTLNFAAAAGLTTTDKPVAARRTDRPIRYGYGRRLSLVQLHAVLAAGRPRHTTGEGDRRTSAKVDAVPLLFVTVGAVTGLVDAFAPLNVNVLAPV